MLQLAPSGAWTAANASCLEALFTSVAPQVQKASALEIDMSGVRELDTLGAWLIEKLCRPTSAAGRPVKVSGAAKHYDGLLADLHQVNRSRPPAPKAINPILQRVEAIGHTAFAATGDVSVFLQMLGTLGNACLGVLRRPRSFRFKSLVYHLHQVGWRAIPIIALVTFLIGAIIAQQGIFHFRKFGADSYVVDLVGILVLREIGVLIVAIMVAGRSGSAYTAELGSMKMREEIDALSTDGIEPHGMCAFSQTCKCMRGSVCAGLRDLRPPH